MIFTQMQKRTNKLNQYSLTTEKDYRQNLKKTFTHTQIHIQKVQPTLTISFDSITYQSHQLIYNY